MARAGSDIAIPLLRSEHTQIAINSKVLAANEKRTLAYRVEQEALKAMKEMVLYAS